MECIITATGKKFEADMVCTLPSPPYLYAHIINSDIDTVRNVFGDTNETVSMKYGIYTIVNYTKLNYVRQENSGVKVRLELDG